MAPYWYLLVFLWFSAGLEVVTGARRSFPLLGMVTFLFLALRFETGYDWPDYKHLYELTPSIFDGSFRDILDVANSELKEPLFVLLIGVLKALGGDFQSLIVFCAAVQVFGFCLFIALLTDRPVLVFVLSVSWLIFTLYMSTLRQGLAVTLFMGFMVLMDRRRLVLATLVGLVGLMFQYSSIAYFLIYFVARFTKSNRVVLFIFAFVALVALLGVDFSQTILEFLGGFGPGIVNEKIDYYLNTAEIRANSFDKAYTFLFSTAVFLLLYFFPPAEKEARLVKVMHGMALLYCIIAVFFYDFPLLRNRVQYLVLPFCYFFVARIIYGMNLRCRSGVYTALVLINGFYFYLFLDKASSAPFVPYQDFLTHVSTGDYGDGLNRYEQLR